MPVSEEVKNRKRMNKIKNYVDYSSLEGNNRNQKIRYLIMQNVPEIVGEVEIEKKSYEMEHMDYFVEEEFKVIDTTIIEDEDKPNYLSKRVETENGLLIPINDICWKSAIEKIMDSKGVNIENLSFSNYENDYENINIPDNLSYSYEIEGGFDIGGFKEELQNKGFNVTYDSTAHTDAYNDEQEIKLDTYATSEEIMPMVSKMLRIFREYEFLTSHNCGTHIHIGDLENQWDGVDLFKICYLFSNIEKEIYRYLPNSRIESEWCRPVQRANSNLYRIVNDYSIDEYDPEYLRDEISSASHNRGGLNPCSFFGRGTIEFRYFDSNPDMLPHYIDWVTGLVKLALNEDNLTEIVQKINEDSTVMFETINITDESAEKIIKQAENKNQTIYEDIYEKAVC